MKPNIIALACVVNNEDTLFVEEVDNVGDIALMIEEGRETSTVVVPAAALVEALIAAGVQFPTEQ